MDVINFSGNAGPEVEPTRDIVAMALDAAAAAGVVSTIAAGNEFRDVGAGSVTSPASSTRTIAAGAVEISGNPAEASPCRLLVVGPTDLAPAQAGRRRPRRRRALVRPGWLGIVLGYEHGRASRRGCRRALVQRHPDWTVAQVKSALVQTGVDATGEGSERLPPTFQGGGVIALARADRPLLFAEPSSLSFGLLDGEDIAQDRIVQLRDAGGGAGTWAVSLERLRSAPSFSVDLARSEVSVPGDLTLKIRTAGPPRRARSPATSCFGVETTCGGSVLGPQDGPGSAVIGLSGWPGPASTVARPSANRPRLRYRYPESPRGIGVTTVLRGPELVYRFVLARRVANFGVVVTSRAAGARGATRRRRTRREPADRAGGPARQPQPYLEGFHASVPAAGALSPHRASTSSCSTVRRAGAGRFAFRFWVNDVTPPTLRVATRVVRAGARCACSRPTPARASTRRRSSRRSTATASRRRSGVALSRSRRGA